MEIAGGTHHVGETGRVVRVGMGGDDEAAGESGKAVASSAAMLTVLSDTTQAEVLVADALVHGCAAVSAGPGGSGGGQRGRGGRCASSAVAAATDEDADADVPDPELERTLQANAQRIQQQQQLIGQMIARVELLETQQ